MLTVTGFFDIIRNCLHLMNNMNITRNLNMAKKTLDKVDKSKTETFGLLCCETGPLSLAYNINKTGFVCGEKAKMNIKVNYNHIIVSKHLNIFVHTLLYSD